MPRWRLSAVLGGLAGGNILLAFLFQWYTITLLGAGKETDALFAGMLVPQMVLGIFTGSLSYVLVPILATQEEQGIAKGGWTFLHAAALLFLAVVVVLFLSAGLWVPRIVPGFSASAKSLTVSLVRIQIISLLFIGPNGIVAAVCYARERFVRAECAVVLAAACGLLFLLWALPRWGVKTAAWGMVLRSFLEFVFLVPAMGAYRAPDWRSSHLRLARRRIVPLILGSAYYKTDQLVDRFLGSMAPAGHLSLLCLGIQMVSAGTTIVGKALSAPLLPRLSRASREDDLETFNRLLGLRLLTVLAIVLGGLLALVIGGRPVLGLLFGFGRFQVSQVTLLWSILIGLGGVLVGGAAGQLISNAFYAQGDTRTPTRIGMLGFTMGIGFKAGGYYLGGILGLALGTSLYYVLNGVWMYGVLQRRRKRKRQPHHR